MKQMAAMETDEELMERARRGCRDSFAAIYQRHAGRVYRFAVQLTGKTTAAEEITQEVFLALLAALGSYDVRRGALVSYLLGVARNQTYRKLRLERPGVELEEDCAAGAASAESELVRLSDVAWLRRAIAQLPPAFREVVVLCELEEMDYAQAAQVLGIPIGTVRSRLHRARGQLIEQWRVSTARAGERVGK